METIVCIFCLKDKLPSDEHVIPRSLGGNLIIRCVCKECNNGLSHLDQSLADASLLLLPRLMHQPGATWGHSAYLAENEENKQILEIKIGHKLESTVKTQLIFSKKNDTNKFSIRGRGSNSKGYEEFFKVLRKQLSKNGVQGIKTLVKISEDEDDQLSFRLVLNRSNEVVFRPSTKDKIESDRATMIDLIEKRLDEIEKNILEAVRNTNEKRHNLPGLTIHMAPDFEKNLRAVSKIAYTFLASKYGCKFVSTTAFNPLRKYIITGEGADEQCCLWWNGDQKEKSLTSSRFAQWLKENGQPFYFGGPNVHTITIFSLKDRYGIIIEFYSQISFAVDLGNIGVPLQFPRIQEFDYVNKTNREVTLDEIIKNMQRK